MEREMSMRQMRTQRMMDMRMMRMFILAMTRSVWSALCGYMLAAGRSGGD